MGRNFFKSGLIVLWLELRLFTGLLVALVSTLRPLTVREQMIALWPPSAPLGAWLERTLVAPWERWDTVSFVNIVARGYRLEDGTAQFHPLLPLLATPIGWITGQPLLSLLIVSSVVCLALLVVFERLARLDMEPAVARTSTILFLFSPLAFVLFVPYTEGLFLLCAVLCLFWARKQIWGLAGLAGALAVLTRQQGVFLMLPLAWELWEASSRNLKLAVAAWRDWLALGWIPVGILVWLIYRAVALNDLQVDWSSPHTMIYSFLISSSAIKIVPVQTFMWPWQALWLALNKLWSAPEANLVIDFIFAAYFIVLLVMAWRSMRISYRIYTGAIVLISFAYHTGPFYPYMGLPRHLLLAFPVFIGFGSIIQRSWQRLLLASVGMCGFFFLLLMYEIEAWIP